MKIESSVRNGTSLAHANASILKDSSRAEEFAFRAGHTLRLFSRALDSTRTVYRRRGIPYFGYLFRGWLVPRIQYGLLFRSSARIELAAQTIAPATIILSSALFLGLYGAIGSALIYGSIKLFSRKRRISEKRRIEQLLKRRVENRKDRGLNPAALQESMDKKTAITIRYDNEEHFLNQTISLLLLSREVRVPALRAIDETKRALSLDFVAGVPVSEALEKMEPEARDTMINKIQWQMNRIHSFGIAGLHNTFKSLIVDSQNEPCFMDFSRVCFYRSVANLHYRLDRDRDRNVFNRLFDRQIMTEKIAREALEDQKKRIGEWYAPIDFGHGLTVGHFWSTDSGTGRWDYFNARSIQTLLPGKRILDLGCNTGVMDILMLRAGAKEVVGLEQSFEAVEAGKTIKEIFEWTDHRQYNLTMHNTNMLNMVTENYGKFDIVTTFCSLYYLSEEDMARVVRKAAELSPLFVLQTTVYTKKEHKMRKSTLDFLIDLLQTNGYPNVQIVAPHGYSRPLLIARRAKPSQQISIAEPGALPESDSPNRHA
jgi:SAM-dependent methyltransferase